MDRPPSIIRGASAAAIAISSAMAAAAQYGARSTARTPAPQQPLPTKIGRNDPCPCGSGRKFKQCCLARQKGNYERDPAKLPKPRALDDAEVTVAVQSVLAPASNNATAMAMLHAGVSQRIVWAYLETGCYMTESNKVAYSPENVAKWEAALAAFDAATPEEQAILLAPAVVG